jgi:hypothetical protein
LIELFFDYCAANFDTNIAEMHLQMNKAETALLSLSAFCIYPKRKRRGVTVTQKNISFFSAETD